MVSSPYLVIMNVHINQLVKSLLQKDSIEQCSLQELQQFADSNPHFGAAQLLLTKKLKSENSERYNEQLQKTFLYFHNPMWVEHLLNETGSATIKAGIKKAETVVEAPAAITEIALNETAVAATPNEEQAPAEIEIAGVVAAQEPLVISEAALTETDALTTPVADKPTTDIDETIQSEEQIPVIEPVPAPTQHTAATPDMVPVAEETGLTNPAFTADAVKDDLLFEPYHTIDYFASQGIKLKEEEKPADKFSQQLRSFTDWLKTLKKQPVAEIAKQPATVTEKKVEQLAAHSLQDDGVVTETMAEVWEKQGNMAKAIDLYSKLSLLEPAKSTYFAAKIEELKKQL